MEIKLISIPHDKYPPCGFFIEGANLESWLATMNEMGLNPLTVELYALPSHVANAIWGCLVLTNDTHLLKDLGRFVGAHHISNKLIIPEKTKIVPELTAYDLASLFETDRYVYHMDFGLFKLEEPLTLSNYIQIDDSGILHSMKPIPHAAIDPVVKSFRVEATPEEELKAEMEAPQKREKLENKPLNFGEKTRLKLYQQFLKTEKDQDGNLNIDNTTAIALANLARLLGMGGSDVGDRVLRDYESLLERNKKELEKLMDLLDKNPEEALRYAIPLDEHGYSRGEQELDFTMQDRGGDFSLFGNRGTGSGGGRINLGDEYYKLQLKYRRTAETLEKKGEHEKAAFVYLKLLKDYSSAALVLRRGKLYEKAAYIYTEYLKNELLAAECYEDGMIYEKAIELYKKNNKLEKAGDLYVIQGKQKLANKAYQKVVDDYLDQSQYLKASLLSRNKLFDLNQTQQILLKGWNNSTDARSCLSMYFANIPDADEALEQVNYIKNNHVDSKNDVLFLKVLKNEYQVRNKHKAKLRDLGYTLISELLERGAIASNELLAFNKKDKRLAADTIRYNINKKTRMKE